MRISQCTPRVILLLVLVLLGSTVPAVWAAVNTLLQVQSEFVVNSAGDENDALPGDGLCQTASGDCTLRAALEEANALPGVETITFNIPGAGPHLIRPESPLPRITEAIILDGTTQPGYEGQPLIELAGSQAGQQASGLTITASDSTVRGLAIHSFDRSGIHLSGGQNNQIEANYLGTTGTVAHGNQIGILVEGSTLNVIGGNEPGDGNLISGNEVGVYIYGAGTSENRIAGNLIGTDARGTAVLGNEYGIRITAAAGNLVGGDSPAARNVIAGNETGIYIQGEGAGGNRTWGNYLGLDVTGAVILGNDTVGVYLLDAPDNQVGGPNAAGNHIAGGELGVYTWPGVSRQPGPQQPNRDDGRAGHPGPAAQRWGVGGWGQEQQYWWLPGRSWQSHCQPALWRAAARVGRRQHAHSKQYPGCHWRCGRRGEWRAASSE